MIKELEDEIQRMQKLWNETHEVPALINAAGRKVDPSIDDANPDDAITVGLCLVYPNKNFVGWYDVRLPDGAAIVSFAGRDSKKNAMDWAQRWSKQQ